MLCRAEVPGQATACKLEIEAMERPIYAGSPPRRAGRRRTVFAVVAAIHLILIGGWFYFYRSAAQNEEPEAAAPAGPPAAVPAPEPASGPSATVPAPEPAADIGALEAVEAALDAGRIIEAHRLLQPLPKDPSAKALRLLGVINLRWLKSALPMENKAYHVVQPGDYLQKIARASNTTVELIKSMNGMETDTIRIGARLLVFSGEFSILISKSENVLDLMLGERLFKRYLVGTGTFGRTPSAEFTIYDKIIEPPWTRPPDNQRIEYGDPENVLGTRWMAIRSADNPELTGFGIHGTWQRGSIGSSSSAGCVRMLNEDVEELFDLVPRKTRVTIIE